MLKDYTFTYTYKKNTFIKPVFLFRKTTFTHTFIYISTLSFINTHMQMTYLSGPPTNMQLIGEVCDSLGTDSLTLFVGYHWATGRLRVNSTFVKGGIISDSLFAGNIANDTYGWLWCGSH